MQYIVPCDCHDLRHILSFEYDDDFGLSVSIGSHPRSIIERARSAWNTLVGKDDYHEVIIPVEYYCVFQQVANDLPKDYKKIFNELHDATKWAFDNIDPVEYARKLRED